MVLKYRAFSLYSHSHQVRVLQLLQSCFVLLLSQLNRLTILITDCLAGILPIHDSLVLQQQGSQLLFVQLNEFLLLVLVAVHILALTHALAVVHHVITDLIVHFITVDVLIILFCTNHHLVLPVLLLVIHLILALIVLITIIIFLCISLIASVLVLVHLLLIIVVLVLLMDHLLLRIVLLISYITHLLAAVFLHVNLAVLLRIDLSFVVFWEVSSGGIKLVVVVGRD